MRTATEKRLKELAEKATDKQGINVDVFNDQTGCGSFVLRTNGACDPKYIAKRLLDLGILTKFSGEISYGWVGYPCACIICHTREGYTSIDALKEVGFEEIGEYKGVHGDYKMKILALY